MTELLIKQNKGLLKTKPLVVFILFGFFILEAYVTTGFSARTQVIIFIAIVLTVFAYRYQYTSESRQVLINKSTGLIQVRELSFIGATKTKNYKISNFDAIHSYISKGRGALNFVEILTIDGNRGLMLNYFAPCRGKRFWSFETETENPDAANMAAEVAEFIPVKNLGFMGHKSVTTQIGIDDNSKFIRSML